MHIVSHRTLAQVRLARVIPSMHVHLCVALWLFLFTRLLFLFVPLLFFQPFQMSSSEFHEKLKSKTLCDFRLGTVATSDHETPLTQSGHCILEEISHSSKNSVLPMLVTNSFDFSLNGLNSPVLSKSSMNESQFGSSRTVESVSLRLPCD